MMKFIPKEETYGKQELLSDIAGLQASQQEKQNGSSLEELLRACILCHNARVAYDNDKKEEVYEAYRKEDIAVLNFCKNHLFKYDNPSSKANQLSEYEVNIKGRKEKHTVMGVSDFSPTHKRFSIVCQEIDELSGGTLYIKGQPKELLKLLKLEES